MKNTKLDYINISLAIILVVLIIIYFGTRLKNKEQDKLFWKAEIYSTTEDSTAAHSNTIQITDAVFYNTFNHSKSQIDADSKRITSGKSQNSVFFKIWEKELLPDSLNLQYFSIDERKFYKLQTPIAYEKMKSLVKEKEAVPALILEIQPLGKILLKIIPNEKQKTEPVVLEKFIAKETAGNLDMLVYEESLGQKYNRFESIQNITDYADLLQNQYKWSVTIKMEEKDVLKSVYAYSFTNEKIYSSEDDAIAVARNIPQIFYIYWINKKEYNIQYELSPFEILNAFRKLNETGSSGEINLTFKVHKNANAECEISKNGVVIPLKDKYPSKPY